MPPESPSPESPANDTSPEDVPPSDERPGDAPDAPATEQLPSVLEALLFVSDDPVSPASLARILGLPRRDVERALDTLAAALAGRGVRLQIGPDGAQIVTSPESSLYVQYYLGLESQRRLSNAALETLAIVAYQQPVTRATIESIRGVNSDGAVATLRARGLLGEVGRAPGPGRATLLATTQRFLEHFGLERPQDLPPLAELAPPPSDAPQPLEGMGAATLNADPGPDTDGDEPDAGREPSEGGETRDDE
ncbi:MAG: SMC-Scp complex subunit ScpB [Dehalococcoidia bacterium]